MWVAGQHADNGIAKRRVLWLDIARCYPRALELDRSVYLYAPTARPWVDIVRRTTTTVLERCLDNVRQVRGASRVWRDRLGRRPHRAENLLLGGNAPRVVNVPTPHDLAVPRRDAEQSARASLEQVVASRAQCLRAGRMRDKVGKAHSDDKERPEP